MHAAVGLPQARTASVRSISARNAPTSAPRLSRGVMRAEPEKKSFLDAVTEEDKPKKEEKEEKRVYLDQLPKKKDNMSPAMKEKLRREYYSIGGAPDKAASNIPLQIILVVAGLAVLCAATGIL